MKYIGKRLKVFFCWTNWSEGVGKATNIFKINTTTAFPIELISSAFRVTNIHHAWPAQIEGVALPATGLLNTYENYHIQDRVELRSSGEDDGRH